jgi:hypothetical protein
MDLSAMKEAFPDFPEGDIPLGIQAGGWDDMSWPKDLLPCFKRERSNLELFINRFYPEDRTGDTKHEPRFTLQYDSDGGSPPCYLYRGEDYGELMATVEAFEKGMGI